jgi:uncharacterized protein
MTKTTLSYDDAHQLFNAYLKTDYLRKHCRETEVIMRRLARQLNEDESFWGITGLLHDLDMDSIDRDYSKHGYKTLEILRQEGYEIPAMFHAILSHTEGLDDTRPKRQTLLDYCLAGAENITGIISAYVLLRPGGKLEGTKPKSIRKKLKDRSFAASVNREFIADVPKKTGMEESEFIQLAIDAMTEIADETGM